MAPLPARDPRSVRAQEQGSVRKSRPAVLRLAFSEELAVPGGLHVLRTGRALPLLMPFRTSLRPSRRPQEAPTRRWKWACQFCDVVGFANSAELAHSQAYKHRLKLHRAQVRQEKEDRDRHKARRVGDHFEWVCNVCRRVLKAPSQPQLQCMHWRHIRVDHVGQPIRDFTTLEGRCCRTNQVFVGCGA